MSDRGGIVGEFFALKEGVEADLLAMQVGDFYEFFADDARTVARELDLKVSEKSSHGSSHPMAGVPVDDLTPYLKALVERGYRVAVADQRGEDDTTREVVRVASPGTLLETDAAEARYLAALVRDEAGYGAAFADVTTGRFHVTTVDELEDLRTECYRFDPVEVLPGPDLRDEDGFVEALADGGATITLHEANAFAPGAARHAVTEQFGAGTIDSLGLSAPGVRAAGAALSYLFETGLGVSGSMTRLATYRPDDHVALDATTQRNLELTEPMAAGGTALVDVLDHTVTSPGSRLLREWLTRPRRDEDLLARRLDAVAALAERALAREAIREILSAGGDVERLASRAVHGSADARDLLSVRDTLGIIPELSDRIAADPTLAGSPLPAVLDDVDRNRAAEIHGLLDEALVDDPPGTVTEGGLIARGYHEELDEVVAAYEDAAGWIDDLAAREKARLGITHLQVGRNRTDGYYIQVGRSEADAVPEAYEEVKTLKNSKRFTTEALREREREVLRLEAERADLEYELFSALRERVGEAASLLQDAGLALAEVDVLASLATHAVSNGWTRPELGGDGLAIEAGRHPVVEQTVEFVPNDAVLAGDRRFLIVTGPNMSGKSTYLRGTALIALLAQVGSFVPADGARVEPVDGIFTRVGALDELAEGRSTFMVEMAELSNILHAATEDSLVVLDEVGRGTATYDGISIAWAATEYLASTVRARTLFATHYHELTQLGDHLDGVSNVHVAAEERDGDVTFLRSVREGPTDRSYGIHVADLAGVPSPVVDRARDVLARLREDKAIDVRGGSGTGTTQVVFDLGSGGFRGSASADGGDKTPLDPGTEFVLEELRGVDVNELSPLELMAKVTEWQERLDDG